MLTLKIITRRKKNQWMNKYIKHVEASSYLHLTVKTSDFIPHIQRLRRLVYAVSGQEDEDKMGQEDDKEFEVCLM